MNNSQKPAVRRHSDLITLLAAIDESGLADRVVAARAEISHNTLYWWRTAKVRCGRHETMARVAAVLGLRWALLRTNR